MTSNIIEASSKIKKAVLDSYEIENVTSEDIQKIVIDLLAMNSLILWKDLHVEDKKEETENQERWCQDNFIWTTLNILRGEMFHRFFESKEGL